MTMHIVEENIRQALTAMIAPQTTKRGTKIHSILKFRLITRILLVMRRNHGIENHVIFMVFITMWLFSAGRER